MQFVYVFFTSSLSSSCPCPSSCYHPSPDRITSAIWRSWLWWLQLSATTWTTEGSTTPTYRGTAGEHESFKYMYDCICMCGSRLYPLCGILTSSVCTCVSRSDHPLAQLYCHSTMEHHHFDQCLMILNSPVGALTHSVTHTESLSVNSSFFSLHQLEKDISLGG